MPTDIQEYHGALDAEDVALCDVLKRLIDENLPGAHSKVWHGHPVWFLSDNPIVGYSKKKSGIELLFWSGQSFPHPGLRATGKFKAAQRSYTQVEDMDEDLVLEWLTDAEIYQWDYAGLLKKHVLEKLTSF